MKINPKVASATVAAVIAIAAPVVARWEGTIHRTYLDPIRVLTACTGHTGPELRLGQTFTPEQCGEMLNKDLQHHAEGVASCTPTIFDRPKVAAAATSLAFNIGVNAYCKSTAARKFNSGDLLGGCVALGRFVYAGGKKLRGLERRRAAEVKLCLEGVNGK